ncbi:ATP-binding protein [Zafaria sp. Z1313]|uniref:sensor histidine kinase n=1 Tax=Zafaria sp. Z1313 TaxID=3423202 RepID=UPI003D302430
MTRRLILLALPLLLTLMAAIGIPWATAIAERHSTALANDRIADATRFAMATLHSLTADNGVRLERELDDYAELFGSPVWVVDREREVLHAHGGGALPAGASGTIDAALAGQLPQVGGVLWPWGPDAVYVAAPVGIDSQVTAALVIEVPTTRVKDAVLEGWLRAAVVLAAAMTAAVWILWPLSRWVLKPIRTLAAAADRVAVGELGARARGDAGPPELRALAGTFNRMAHSVQDTFRRQEQFVHDASHQLRTPLTAVRLAVENLEPELTTDDGREIQREAVQELDRMGALVESMLAATQAGPVATGAVDTSAGLGGREELWAAAAAARGFGFSAAIEPASGVAEPTGGLAQVLDELVENALRLSGGTRVGVTGRSGRGDYVIEVADDGRGLSPAEAAQATGRFWRSPAHQNIPGTGLGLQIVEQSVRDVGGSLELESPPAGGGTGLVARIRLPRRAPGA